MQVALPVSSLEGSVGSISPEIALVLERRRHYLVIKRFIDAVFASFLVICLSLIPYGVDGAFWQPLPDQVPEARLICSAGLEFRDYPTLIEAVRAENVQLVIAAASHWSRRRNRAAGIALPDNVRVTKLDYFQLRDLYARACFVVVPLYDVDFQAGITTILEAMAMGKAVIVSRTHGQIDTIIGSESSDRDAPALAGYPHLYPPLQPSIDTQTGIYVTPGSISELRSAIQRLLADPSLAEQLGRNGRQLLEERFTLELFVNRVAQLLLLPASNKPTGAATSLSGDQ
ncbi:MAG: glycosyltransferase family 4 protein [Chloroflexi bacterium]|nr:glycosyltransferase family 4 protein [Chloroflexota bacterium]